MNLKIRAMSGVKWTSSSAVFNAVMVFLQTVVLARLLIPEDFGLMGMLLIIVGFSQLFSDIGISNAIIHRREVTRYQLSSLYWTNIIAGILVFCLVNLSTPLLVKFFNEPQLYRLIIWMSLVFLIVPFGQQFDSLLKKDLRFNLIAKISMVSYCCSAGVTIILAFLGYGVFSLIMGQIALAFARSSLLTIFCIKEWCPLLHFDSKDLQGFLGFGLFQVGDKAANYFSIYLPQIFIGSFLGSQTLGYYTLAHELVFKPTQVINPIITKVTFPALATIQNDSLRIKRAYLKLINLLTAINFPTALGLAVVAPFAIVVLYGPQWHPAVPIAQILAIIAALRSMGSPLGSLMLAMGRPEIGFKWSLGKLIFQMPIFYWASSQGGIGLVLVSLLCFQLLVSFLTYPFFIRTLLGSCLREYLASLWPSFWMTATMSFLVFVLGSFLQPTLIAPAYILLAQVLIGTMVYFSLIICCRHMLFFELKALAKERS